MNVLITGATGLLGQAVYRRFNQNEAYNVTATGRTSGMVSDLHVKSLNLTNRIAFEKLLTIVSPDIIIHCAAMTNVDFCEKNQSMCFENNVSVTRTLISYCKKYSCKLVFLSTDYVFDGKTKRNKEQDIQNPINYYGYTKYLSEQEIKAQLVDYLVIRSTVIFGHEPCIRGNFVMWVINTLRHDGLVAVVNGQYGNPTLNRDLAEMLFQLVKNGKKGLYHAAGNDWMNRYEMAREAAIIFGFSPESIHSINPSQYNPVANRPEFGGFDLSKIKTDLGYEPLSYKKALLIMKELWKNHEM